ncbi:hypothetical protein GH714_032106 [Hevea brasiliensis]|uniref:Pentacotripeptide-repeat region of PRORP domain-containing protein n=1 Tax=Hevea brasiliensis TaxID=3981 RepID=A0A6A6M2D0_HEVBR|nr:hypothetical protein GH714_032106 [Hevea brasiliensis]
MYAKAGKILDARGVFESLPERDVVSCTSIISGCAQLGLDEEALELFRRLQREGMSSNHVTYASLLTAFSGLAALNHGKQVRNHFARCEMPFYVVLQNSLIDMSSKYHGRLEDKGLEIFDVMVKGNNGIQAEIEHYGCVVDLLRSAGRVEEGFEFYQKDAF